MKRHLVAFILGIALSICTTTSTYGAGQISFDNYNTFGGMGAPIYMGDGSTPIAPGAFVISLYYQLGNVADPAATGTLIATTLSGSGDTGPGYYDGGIVTIPDYPTSGAPPGGITFEITVALTGHPTAVGHSITLNVPSIATGSQFPTELDIPSFEVYGFLYTTASGSITITGYTGPGGGVTVPSTINGLPVTVIGNNAFDVFLGNTSPTAVTIPDSVTVIGNYVFNECFSLSQVYIGRGVTSIGTLDFLYCPNLNAITVDALNTAYSSIDGVLFNKSQTTLSQYPLGRQSGSYTIPIGVANIGSSAFLQCRGLTNVSIPDSVTSIGSGAFANSSLTGITIPNRATIIGDNAFHGCYSLRTIIIPDSVTSIGSAAFEHTGLTRIMIPRSVTSIESSTFDLCGSLTNVTMPDGLTSIGDLAFYYCTNLATLTIGTSVTKIGNRAFNGCTSLTNLTVPNSVTNIGDSAFGFCTRLQSITLPGSVASLGEDAFGYCTNLTSIYFKGNAPSGDSSVFQNDNNVTAYYLPGTLGWGSTFALVPTAWWTLPYPLILNSANGTTNLGVQSNKFGFTVSWATNLSIVLQACANLANPVWTPVATNPLVNGMNYFSDSEWTNYPARFYRISSP